MLDLFFCVYNKIIYIIYIYFVFSFKATTRWDSEFHQSGRLAY